MQLTGRGVRKRTMRAAVDHHSALAADPFATVVIEFHRPLLLLDQLLNAVLFADTQSRRCLLILDGNRPKRQTSLGLFTNDSRCFWVWHRCQETENNDLPLGKGCGGQRGGYGFPHPARWK